MFIPSRHEYAFRVNHSVHMDFMIDGVMIGSSTNTGSLTRSNSGTHISKQMFMQLDSGWHSVRIRGYSTSPQPKFDFIREARSLDWQQPPAGSLRAIGYEDCDWNGINDFVDEVTDFDLDNVSGVGTLAEAFEPITMSTCGSNFDTEIAIFDAVGDLVAENDDFCGPLPARQSQLDLTLAAGTYYIAFGGYNTLFSDGFGIATNQLGTCSEAGDLEITVGSFSNDGDILPGRALLIRFEVEEAADCPADLTGDGNLNFFDVSAFLTAFGMGCP